MTHYISQGRVGTPIRIGAQFWYSSVSNLVQYPCATNSQNKIRFDKVIAKNERVHFFVSSACSSF